jgi:hypothetical protein
VLCPHGVLYVGAGVHASTPEGLLGAENQRRGTAWMSVIVPTVECDPPPRRFWSTTIATFRFSIASASGCAQPRHEVAEEQAEVLGQKTLRFGRNRGRTRSTICPSPTHR